MTFPRNDSLFRNKNKTKAIYFNPKCMFFFFIKEVHILTVSTLQNLSILLHHVSIQVYLVTAKTRG